MSDSRLLPKCKCGRPAPIGKRKCARCLKTTGFKRTRGRDTRRGANAVGIAAHKPATSHTKKAKRQNPPSGGPAPLHAYQWRTT